MEDVNQLTPLQKRILKLYAEGTGSAKEIAKILLVTEGAIEYHIGLIKKKLNINNYTHLVHAALASGVAENVFALKIVYKNPAMTV